MKKLAGLLAEQGHTPRVTVLEAGALPVGEDAELCHQLLAHLPGSRVLAFEPDQTLCQHLNAKAQAGIQYFPFALGKAKENRVFYETEHPMCSSLYRPDPRWDRYFNNLHYMREKSSGEVSTVTVDAFLLDHQIERIDFFKMDVQGAEYEILLGAAHATKEALAIVCEVEFVPLYENQPLFGDVDRLLRSQGFMFHKFLGLAGRAMKPITVNDNLNFPVQHMWSDAVFVRSLLQPESIADEDLLKLALIMDLYGSPDVTHFCLAQFDARTGSHLADGYLRLAT
jgi:FkbM family methyltransferase